jgi:PQQ-dependent catabolism-associated CXXCW motif protein
MSVQADSYDALAAALHELSGRLGPGAFTDRRRLISLLSDQLPEARREIRLVGTAIDEGVPAALASAERHLVGLEMDRQASRLEASAGLRLDLAKAIVRAFAFALNLGPLPSVYQDWSATPAPVPAPVAGGEWAGISSPVHPTAHGGYPPPPAPVYYQAGPTTPPAKAAGFRLEQKHMLMIAGAVTLAVGASQFMSRGDDSPTNEAVTNEAVTVDTKGEDAAPKAERNYAGELDDLGVASKATLESNVGSATPLQIPAGARISTDGLQQLLARDSSALLIDVLDNPHPTTIRNAAYLPSAGKPGTFDDQHQATTAAELRRLVAGKADRPLIFFCAGAACWESYNAVLRANAAGYRNLHWYRGGLASWSAAGLPMQPLQPAQSGAANIF